MGRCCSSFNDATYSETEATPIRHLHSSQTQIKSSVKCRKTAILDGFLINLVRVGRLELPASCSQSKRATNCATPGYEIFQLWSNMWSTPIFDQLPATGKVLSAQLSQDFLGFPRATARTWASRSQSRRATNCATPRYKIVELSGRFPPKQARYQLRNTPI